MHGIDLSANIEFKIGKMYFARQLYISRQTRCLLSLISSEMVFVPPSALSWSCFMSRQVDVTETLLPEILLTLETSFSYVSGLELQLECQFASSRFQGTVTSYFMRRPLVGTPTSEIQFPDNIRDYECENIAL